MAKPCRWVRHRVGDGIVWSPEENGVDRFRQSGPVPKMNQMEPMDETTLDELNVLPPADPKRIVALAKNRTSEQKDPLLFLMTSSSLIGHKEPIQLRKAQGMTWAEVELAAVIDKTAKRIKTNDADSYIRGYTVANDVTTETEDGRDWHLAKGKARDTFCPAGPYLVTDIDPLGLSMETRINGEITHRGTTDEQKYDIFNAVSYVSNYITLEPGDLVLSGTPPDPFDSKITHGDTATVSIENIGSLTNPVEEDKC